MESVFAGLGAAGSLRFLDMPEITVSSMEVRQLIHQGEAYRHLVPEPVAEIIENEDLYGQSKD